MRRTDGDAGRDADALEQSFAGPGSRIATHPHASSNLAATSAASASSAGLASRPSAEMVITQPSAAASIINPMLEVQPTSFPSSVTVTASSKLYASLTHFPAARACTPTTLL